MDGKFCDWDAMRIFITKQTNDRFAGSFNMILFFVSPADAILFFAIELHFEKQRNKKL